jgi:hypothetical protein
MGHRIEFELKHRIVLLSFTGVVTDDSLLIGISDAVKFITAHGTEGIIVDFSGIESFRVSVACIRNYVSIRETFAQDKPRVIVAPQPVVYEMSRTFQVLVETSVDVLLVRTLTQAHELLKLKSPVFGAEPWSARPKALGAKN